MQFKNYDKFKRVNDKTSQELLGADEAAVLKDCVLDFTLGKPRKRGGFGKFDAAIPERLYQPYFRAADFTHL